jgi:uncharacterized protein YceH (UPF0502 family)
LEKAKTTPDAYPLTLTALATGCNQKSNRDPQMNLTLDQVEDVVDQLRVTGAVARVEGSGRVTKVRHYAYQWFGINGPESAVVTELLLRGAQTLGELRQRASRMESIVDLGSLQVILTSLQKKNLIVYLTPAGRGQIVTHNVYLPEELASLRSQYANYKEIPDESDGEEGSSAGDDSAFSGRQVGTGGLGQSSASVRVNSSANTAALESKVEQLQQEVVKLTQRVEELEKFIRT